MTTIIINYFFDKEEVKEYRLYCNLFYYSFITIAIVTLLMSLLWNNANKKCEVV